jgi:RNA polymerase primary sigma factor
MAVCVSRRIDTREDDHNIFDRQAEMLDELLSGTLLEADSLEEMVCTDEDSQVADESDAEQDAAGRGTDMGDAAGSEEHRITSEGSATGDVTGGDASEEDLFQGDLISCYLQEISRFPLLSPEREIELAKTIKEGQEAIVGLIWDERATECKLNGLRDKLRKWQDDSINYPGLREKMVDYALAALEREVNQENAMEQQRQLWDEAQEIAARIDEAKNEMVEGNLRLVLSIAKRHRGRGLSFLDLIQEGNIGLLKAVARYDYTKGNRFSTYATWWVRQSIIRGIYDKTRTIRLPVHFIEMKSYFFKIFYELVKELGREPTPMEIADRSGLPQEKVMMIIQLSARPISLEAPLGSEEQRLGDFIADDKAVSPIDDVSQQELMQATGEVLGTLNSREEIILKSRFGIDGRPTETLKTIGERFSVSKERIRQIEKKAIRKLRHSSRGEKLRGFVE